MDVLAASLRNARQRLISQKNSLNHQPLTLVNGRYRTLLFTDVIRAWMDNTVVGTLLKHVSRPAGNTRANKDRREQRSRNAHKAISGGVEEVSIREQLLLVPHQLLDRAGNRVNHRITHFSRQLLGVRLDHLVTRVGL